MRTFITVIAILVGCATFARAGEAINVDKNGLALQGYDPVAYFTDSKPVKGSPDFTATYKGGTYQFVSAEHRDSFNQTPTKYEPQFGGFCALSASMNKLEGIVPEDFQVLDGRLILLRNKKAVDMWSKDPEGNLKKADANWPTLSQQKPPAP